MVILISMSPLRPHHSTRHYGERRLDCAERIFILTLIDAVLEHGELANYYLAHSAPADMYRRLGRTSEARSSYEKALALTQQEPERQFLQERIRQLK